MKVNPLLFKFGQFVVLCFLAVLGGQALAQTANPDNYDTNVLPPFPDPAGFVLTPDPQDNDVFVNLNSAAYYDPNNFVLQSGQGSISVQQDPQTTQNILVYSPPPTFSGTAVFQYTIQDLSNGGTSSSTISINHQQSETNDDVYQHMSLKKDVEIV